MRTFLRIALILGLGLMALGARPAGAQSATALPDRWQVTLDDQQYIQTILSPQASRSP